MNTRTANFSRTRYIVTLGMLTAIAFLVYALLGRYLVLFPAAGFLTYDPKDVIILIAGLIFGPMASFFVSVAVSLIELFTFSSTGFIGFFMNVLSTCAFACTASFIYKKKQTLSGAIWGLAAGIAAMVGAMLLWNYLITPIYMHLPRDAVAGMLLPIFLPFNLIKGGLNAAFTLLLYKPLVLALRRANLVPPSSAGGDAAQPARRFGAGGIVLGALLLLTLVFIILSLWGIL